MILNTLAMILSVATAQAANNLRFTPVEQMLIPPKVLGAVHRIDSSNGQCTSTRISNRGHYLTARHCLQHCLIRSKAFRWVTEQQVISYFERDDSQMGKARCEIEVDGLAQMIEISATSPGLIIKPDEASFASINSKKFAELQAAGFTSEGDFVIYRSLNEPIEFTESCLAVNPARYLSVGDTVQSLGFPGETSRPDGNNSDGEQMYYSRGSITPGISSNSCVKEGARTAEKVESLQRLFDMKSSFMSNLDAVFGASGTAVTNSYFEVVGVLVQTYNHEETTRNVADGPEQRFCEGSAKTLKMSHLAQYIPRELMRDLHCGETTEQLVFAR